MAALSVGAKAPEFELDGSPGKTTLSDLLAAHDYVILAFFPASFSSVCTDEMNLFQEASGEFAKLGAQMVGISVDGKWTQQAFAKQGNLEFPVLADFHPKGAVAEQYGVLREDGRAERALFIIARDGVIRYSYVSEVGKNPGADRLLEALEKLRAPA